MAAASDCVRILEPVLENYGNYIDFDVELTLQGKQGPHSVQMSIILPGGKQESQGVWMPYLNCFFVGVALEPDTQKIHLHASERLNKLKTRILSNYDKPTTQMLSFEFTGCPKLIYFMNQHLLTNIGQLLTASDFNLFIYRKTLEAVKAQMSETLFQTLYQDSVEQVTGPMVWYALFPESQKIAFPNINPNDLNTLAEAVDRSGYEVNGLKECIHSLNVLKLEEFGKPKRKDAPWHEGIGDKCDLSWTPMGAYKLKEKSEKLNKGIEAIQSATRGALARMKF